MLAAAIWSSSGRYGTAAMIEPNMFWTLRVSASSSFDSSTTSGTSTNSPTRYGSSSTRRSSRMRRTPWTRIRSVPSGMRISLWTTAAVPISCRSSQPGVSTSSFLTVTRATIRSPLATSSTSLIERSWPIASGVIDCGKTTVSFSGRTGSVGGHLDLVRIGSELVLQLAHGCSRRSPRTIRIRPVRGFWASGITMVSSPRS